jgi:uncharacterized protein YyaL (SSP411 family)
LSKPRSLAGATTNRLARESSPYLLLHAANPVDWYPWSEEALQKARTEDKPIFLSVGYSTCYWCHVMERECFSDPEIAAQMNEGFVSIKLDREERPDLDEIYMAATQLLTRSGGWPNSVFLTPELKPFFAGTYFPPRDAHGRPGFPRVLQSLREAWALRRAEVNAQAEAIAEAMREHLAVRGDTAGALDPGTPEATERALSTRFDPVNGGFTRAPKFPSPSNLFFLLERAEAGSGDARDMLVTTLDHMARGGLFDHLAGGFHRYSVDARWLVPHFEKMLYDNAALAPLYAAADALRPEAGFARVARATLAFVEAEMTDPQGGFLSAIDAETDGEEGAYYTFTREELKSTLSPADDALLAPIFGFDGPPNFEHGRYVLHLPRPLSEVAQEQGLTVEALLKHLEGGRRALLAARARRERPLVDDKVLADWNGLMIAAFAETGRRLGEPALLEPARRAATFVLASVRDPETGTLRHAWREGQSRVDAFLDDYAYLIAGLLALHEAGGEERWLQEALVLQAEQEQRLGDAAGGYFGAAEAPDLLFRSKPAFDGATASGNGYAVLNLLEFHRLTGDAAFRARAEAALGAFGGDVSRMPLAHVTLVRALLRGETSPATPAVRAAPRPKAPAPAPDHPAVTRQGGVLTSGSAVEDLEDEAREAVEVVGRLAGGHEPVRGFSVELKVRKGFHVYANPTGVAEEAGAAAPTATSLTSVLGRAVDIRYPPGELDPAAGEGIRVYRGRVSIEGRIEMPRTGAPSLELSYQVCDDTRCLPAVTRLVRLE